jgi:hypothetical protein
MGSIKIVSFINELAQSTNQLNKPVNQSAIFEIIKNN